MIKAVIFDLDGTLIDSMGVWYKTDRIFLRENNIVPPDDISDKMKKMSIEESAQYFVNEFGLNCTPDYVIKRIEEIVFYEYTNNIQLKDNVTQLLDYLDAGEVSYCIATATYKKLAKAVLERFGIYERFKFILTGEDVKKGKTSPEIYLKCAEKLGCNPNEILVAEDSLHCVETASSSGFFTVGVYDNDNASDWSRICKTANKTVKNIYEISEIISEMENK